MQICCTVISLYNLFRFLRSYGFVLARGRCHEFPLFFSSPRWFVYRCFFFVVVCADVCILEGEYLCLDIFSVINFKHETHKYTDPKQNLCSD
jgi:hypothetical protein